MAGHTGVYQNVTVRIFKKNGAAGAAPLSVHRDYSLSGVMPQLVRNVSERGEPNQS